jgi:asparagine synthetase B (glutamine-hydrolysing)
VLLSGGIDSSAVFWYAAAREPSLQTFTKTSPGIETIPLTVVPRLLQQRPATAHFILQRRAGFVRDLDSFVRRTHAPSRWNSGPSMESLCHAARRNGVIVLLGGDCMDEFFGGYVHYRDYFARDPDPTDLGPLIDLLAGADGRYTPLCETYLGEQRAVRTAILARLAFLPNPQQRLRHATLLHDTATFLQTCSLPHSDAYSMAASVELRNPMLDLDLFSFVINLPMHLRADHHENGEFGKVLFRMLAEREIGSFANVAKEGTRNYAMAMADPALWNVDSFSIRKVCPLPAAPDRRDLIRMINLEMFHNAFFTGADGRDVAERMTVAGRREFDMGGPQDSSP